MPIFSSLIISVIQPKGLHPTLLALSDKSFKQSFCLRLFNLTYSLQNSRKEIICFLSL